jgi:hypothetical protein
MTSHCPVIWTLSRPRTDTANRVTSPEWPVVAEAMGVDDSPRMESPAIKKSGPNNTLSQFSWNMFFNYFLHCLTDLWCGGWSTDCRVIRPLIQQQMLFTSLLQWHKTSLAGSIKNYHHRASAVQTAAECSSAIPAKVLLLIEQPIHSDHSIADTIAISHSTLLNVLRESLHLKVCVFLISRISSWKVYDTLG